MSKSMSVTFADGTSHTYDDVPDEVTQEEVDARAKQEYANKKVESVNTGAHPEALPLSTTAPPTAPTAPTFGDYSTLPTSVGQIAGAAAVPIQIAAEHPTEAAGLAALYKFGQGVNAYKLGKETDRMAALEKAAKQAETAVGHQAIQQQKINLKTGVPSGPVAPGAMTGWQAGQTAQTQAAQQAAELAAQRQAALNAEQSLTNRVRQKAASMVTGLAEAAPMLGTAGRVAGKLLPGAGLALGGVEAYNRAQQGDYLGAGLAGAGGVAGLVPGVGTAINLSTTAINAGRDYSKYLEAKRQYEEQQKRAKAR